MCLDLLDVLYTHGSDSVHVFGVRPLVSDCTDLKSKLEQGEAVNWHAYPVYVHAAVFLNFLESLPTPLLGHKQYDDWMDVVACKNTLETKAKIMRVSKSLPEAHQELLRQLLMVLRKLCREVPRSHVTPVLAGHFVGPSLLWKPGSKFVVYPDSREHASLAALVRCLVLFLDDVWNDIDEQATFFSPRKRSTRKDAAATFAAEVTDTFVRCNTSQFVDSLERESRQHAEIEGLIAAAPSNPQATSFVSGGGAACRPPYRSVHTWPGYGKRRETGPASDVGATARPAAPYSASERASKVATFPRCSNSDAFADFADDDDVPAFPSSQGGGEDYLYPDWAFQYPEWNLLGTELPGWAARSCFTLDMNSLAEQTTRKWIAINTSLHNRTTNVTTSETTPAHNTLSGTRL
ncbi:uncharacterized protein LOC144175181 [Haemaphysalis longicornis]